MPQINDQDILKLEEDVLLTVTDNNEVILFNLAKGDEKHYIMLSGIEKDIVQRLSKPISYKDLKINLLDEFNFEGMALDDYLSKLFDNLKEEDLINIQEN